MVRVACTMMQKNEDVLLEPWLTYHGHLFGYQNIFVFDNGSTIPSVIATLRRFAEMGVAVDRQFATVADYAEKGNIIADCICNLQARQLYDLVFPLDCDEFVVMKDGVGATADPARILAYAEAVRPGSGLLRVDTQFFNIINRPGEFGRMSYTKTVIALDGTFASSDHGHHHCAMNPRTEYRPCDFAFVHYHYKPITMLRDHARAKLAPFVNVDDPAAVDAFDGPGNHLCRYLTMTEEEFQNWHKGDRFYVFTDFNAKLAEFGITIPF